MQEEDTDDCGESSAFDKLPLELVEQIISYLFPSSRNQGSLLYVNWAFYTAALPHIYRQPHISSGNLSKFSDAITSRQSTLGDRVQVLNLRSVIHGAKASQLSRLVRRCHRTLRHFHAPQVGFAQSAFRAIGLCRAITLLDLNAVCEKVELSFFLAAVSKATTLRIISFPRFSRNTDGPLQVTWPPHLQELRLSGAINDDLLDSEMPHTLTTVTFENCPLVSLTGILSFLQRHGGRLRTFAALYPLPLPSDSLDALLILCPELRVFTGYVDYFTRDFFASIPVNHPLHTLILDSAGGLLNRENKITADDVSQAILDGRLPHLRQVKWSLRVGWRSDKSDVRDLADLLADVDNCHIGELDSWD